MGAFDAHGTPMGVLIENMRIASPAAAGADAVLALAARPPEFAHVGMARDPSVAPVEGNHNGSHR
jgi:hypothetical protein